MKFTSHRDYSGAKVRNKHKDQAAQFKVHLRSIHFTTAWKPRLNLKFSGMRLKSTCLRTANCEGLWLLTPEVELCDLLLS